MKMSSSVSILCTVISAMSVGVQLPVQAASFDYDQLQLIPVRPIESSNALSFFGDFNNNEGQSSYLNVDPTAPDRGHTEISLNASGGPSPYYGVGRNSSPEENGATRAATLEGVSGFSNFANYLINNSIPLDTIGLGYGLAPGRDFTEAWNLGNDILGEDWLGSPESNLEERIYQAEPDAVELFVSFNDEKIINLGYSPFYIVLDYGDTPAFADDFDAFLTEVVPATKQPGLSPLADGLAEAFLQDVKLAGGGVQSVTEIDGVVPDTLRINNGFIISNVSIPLSLRAVVRSVPEPSSVLGLLALTSMGIFSVFKKAKN
ncbi:MAG: PEP-CTERM sorting domain-containing protein [Crocosphaera sp.]|nr:PEP-CTERM sorting domain-containing protein [Crocosphaera sp.]